MADARAVVGLSEEEIECLLQKLNERMSLDGCLIFHYRFNALSLPIKTNTDKTTVTLVEGYNHLRQSKEYYQCALSLLMSIVEDYGSKEEMDKLNEHVKKNTIYMYDIRKNRLNLWRLLTNVASMLEERDIKYLVTRVAAKLKTHSDHIKKDDGYSLPTTLRAFQLLEEKEQLVPTKQPSLLKELLEEMGQKKLIGMHLEAYDPNQPTSVDIMDVKRLVIMETDTSLIPEKALVSYEANIIDAYKAMSLIESNQWPPVKGHFYINLALITSEFMPRSDTFSRATIRGSVDDVYKKKEPIDFESIFPNTITSQKQRAVVLIEGRPGCGKSTLITKVSKDWADGKILRNIEIFLLVRLRRFVGSKHLTLKDMLGLYCPNPKMLDTALDKITANGGEGVCFAFDGLDEYSSKLTDNNVVMKLINGHILPRAAVFMTSRPAASNQFRSRTNLSAHIEILGFLQKEIVEYVNAYYEDKGKAYGLNKYIQDHPNIERMCYLPLHLAMVVFLYDLDSSGHFLPQTETELYKRFTLHTLIRSLERDPEITIDSGDLEVHEFVDLFGVSPAKGSTFEKVCKLAFEATSKQIQMFTAIEIKKLAALPDIPTKQEFDSLGLLTVDRMIAYSSTMTKTFSFLHLTHQEFLSAIHLVYHLEDNKKLETIQEFAGKVHMWVVWKFFCGLYAEKRNMEMSAVENAVYTKTFDCIVAENISTRLSCLNMIHCAFESQYAESCSKLLDSLGGNVDVKDIALNPSDCSALGYVFVKVPKSVKEIDFSYCHLGPDGIAAFVQQLEGLKDGATLSEVNTLRMRARTDYKPVGRDGANNLIKMLKKLPNLGELRLYGNKLESSSFESLAPAIADLHSIHTLILSRNDLKVDTAPMISEVLANVPLLRTFYISYNPLTDKGFADMTPGLLKCKELKIIGVRGTGLAEGTGKHLKEILSTLPKLELIELYQNRLGDKGVCDMIPGLFEAKSLQTIGLTENHISDEGALALAEYLKVTRTLKEMRIYYNHGMTDVGKIALRTAVVERPSHLCHIGLAV